MVNHNDIEGYVRDYIIYHLKKHGNCHISFKSLKVYPKEEIIALLNKNGYDCEIKEYSIYAKDSNSQRKKYTGAVVMFKEAKQ